MRIHLPVLQMQNALRGLAARLRGGAAVLRGGSARLAAGGAMLRGGAERLRGGASRLRGSPSRLPAIQAILRQSWPTPRGGVRKVPAGWRALAGRWRALPGRQRALIAGLASVIVVVAGYALLTSHTPTKAAATRRAPSPAPKPKPLPTPRKTPLTSPFTGQRVRYLRRVLIFKIDNVVDARPPTGLARADIIYVFPVEAELSRIFAVFSARFPPVVGPVRSSREEDIELLRQFGRPAFAFSGAQPNLLPHVEHARIVDLYAGLVGGYFRDDNRAAPHNLYAVTSTLLKEARHASLARDIGFRFGPAPPGGKPTRSYSVRYREASFTFWWSHPQHRWLVWMDGSPAYATEGGQLGARTIVVQYVHVVRSVFRELNIPPPFAVTVGSGTAVVLRGGRAYRVRWSRPRRDGGTTFTLPNGHRMLFAVGQVWVIYAYAPRSYRTG